MALYGAACLRIGYGVAGTAYYVRNYSDRNYLWSADGIYPYDVFTNSIVRPGFSVYEFSQTQWMFELTFHISIVVSILFCLGVGGRLMSFAQYVLLTSIFVRNPALLDGGDNLAYLVLLYLVLVDSTAVLSLGKRRVSHMGPRVSTVLHNFGIILIATQLFIVYVASAMFKIQGQMWQDGTALYYILRVPEFSWPRVTHYIVPYAWPITIGTYFAVWFQLFFPLLVAIRATRVLAVCVGVVFHMAIALLMGLTAFSLYMIATEAIFLSNAHYRRLSRHTDRVFNRISTLFARVCGRNQPVEEW